MRWERRLATQPGQVISEVKSFDNTTLHGFDNAYTYDNLGNRLTMVTNDSRAPLKQTATYYQGAGGSGDAGGTTLSQYGSRSVPRVLEVQGRTWVANVTINGQVADMVDEFWFKQFAFTGNNAARWEEISVEVDAEPWSAGHLFLKANPEVYTYDADGNLLSDGKWLYTYDAENRLITQNTTTAYGNLTGEGETYAHKYDYLGRRAYTLMEMDNSPLHNSDFFYVYDGWNLLCEMDVIDGPFMRRAFAWGLDLSGTVHGAAGAGGLIMSRLHDGYEDRRLFYNSDANGNVFSLRDMLDYLTEYHYDAFGQTYITYPDPVGELNPFRFATQFWLQNGALDPLTEYLGPDAGVYYMKNRWYKPADGRFLTRDPIGEAGAPNLYAYCGNDGVNYIDPWGLKACEISLFIGHNNDVLNAAGEFGASSCSAFGGIAYADAKHKCPYRDINGTLREVYKNVLSSTPPLPGLVSPPSSPGTVNYVVQEQRNQWEEAAAAADGKGNHFPKQGAPAAGAGFGYGRPAGVSQTTWAGMSQKRQFETVLRSFLSHMNREAATLCKESKCPCAEINLKVEFLPGQDVITRDIFLQYLGGNENIGVWAKDATVENDSISWRYTCPKKMIIWLVAICGIFLLVAVAVTRKDAWLGSVVFYSIKDGSPEMLDLALELGADPNRKDEKGRTPLGLVTTMGRDEMIRILIAHGADVSLVDDHVNNCPAVLAVLLLRGSRTLDVLLENGADPNTVMRTEDKKIF